MTPLVLLAGTGAAVEALQPLGEALAGRYSVRLHARHFVPGPGLHAAQGDALVADCPTETAVFAWSSGGLVALHAALAAPARFSRLFLFEPPLWARSDFDPAQLARYTGMLSWAAVRQPRRARQAFWRMVTQRAQGPCGFDEAPAPVREALLDRQDELFDELKAGTGEALHGRLGQLAVPVVALLGERSAPGARRSVERLLKAVPSGELRIVTDVDHLGPVTRPGAVAEAIH